MRKIMMVLALVLATAFGVGTAAAKPTPARAAVSGPRLFHPCDLNRDGRGGGATERLCLTVWGHDAYDVTDAAGGMSSTPAGPVVVTELIAEARLEGAGVAYIRQGLVTEIRQYAKRDK
jgi:hypothetical protein